MPKEMTDLQKIASATIDQFNQSQTESLLSQINQYPDEEKVAVANALELVKEAEANGEIQQQTGLGRLLIAMELAKSAAIAGNEELAKTAQEAYAAGRLAGVLLRQKSEEKVAADKAAAAATASGEQAE